MPASREKLRVTRSTASTRSKASVKKYKAHKPKAEHLTSPGWVPGHADLFKVPDRPSPAGPRTRRSSIYQKAASPSRYRNAKIPASNCRKIRPLKTSMSNSPPSTGIVTRSRRASAIFIKADMPRAPSNPQRESQPQQGESKKSVRSKSASSKVSVASKGPDESCQKESFPLFLFPDSVVPEFPEDSSDSLDMALSAIAPMSQDESSLEAASEDRVQRVSPAKSRQSMRAEAARSVRSSVQCRLRSKPPSAVSVASMKSKKSATAEKSSVSTRQRSTRSITPLPKSLNSVLAMPDSMNSVSPMPNSMTSISPVLNSRHSISPTPSDYIIIPCESDPEISFNTSRQETPHKPASKRFLESMEDNSAPVATRSYYSPASKILKLAIPAGARSEKLLTSNTCMSGSNSTPSSAENGFDFGSPVNSLNSIQKMSMSTSTVTPVDSRRELTLRNISNTPTSRLDETAPPEAYQTPMLINRACNMSETFYETPQVSTARNLNIKESVDFSEDPGDEQNTPEVSRGRCVIL